MSCNVTLDPVEVQEAAGRDVCITVQYSTVKYSTVQYTHHRVGVDHVTHSVEQLDDLLRHVVAGGSLAPDHDGAGVKVAAGSLLILV